MWLGPGRMWLTLPLFEYLMQEMRKVNCDSLDAGGILARKLLWVGRSKEIVRRLLGRIVTLTYIGCKS